MTTGLGYLDSRPMAAEDQLALQRVDPRRPRRRAWGRPCPTTSCAVRMLLRLMGFLSGHAGVSPELCEFIADRLNDGW